MAFTLGQTINLRSVVTAGLPGVILGVTVVVVTGFVCIMADKLLGGSGIAGAAASSTAGNSAAVPKAVAMADTTYVPVAEAATVQVAASVIVTAILTPLLTSWWYKRVIREERARQGGVSPDLDWMKPRLDSQIDELYKLPLDGFTHARNALAKTLSGSDKKTVASLVKPSLAMWIVNQLYWQDRAHLQGAVDASEKLRAAHRAALADARSTRASRTSSIE